MSEMIGRPIAPTMLDIPSGTVTEDKRIFSCPHVVVTVRPEKPAGPESGRTFIAVCNCGIGITAADRAELEGKFTAHLRGDFFPPQIMPANHHALIGAADAMLSIDVRTEALDGAHG